MENNSKRTIAKAIDHTFLRPAGKAREIVKLCSEAREWGFAAVAVAPYYVPLAAREIAGSEIGLSAAIGFPLGYTTPATKACEAAEALEQGATEIDMVANITAVKSGVWEEVKRDIQAVARVCQENVLKVILETCYLEKEEMEKLAEICLQIEGVDFLKTSTGFGPEGAKVEDIRFLKKLVGDKRALKASGGIKTLEDCRAMLEAGASRIGTSSGVKIMQELN